MDTHQHSDGQPIWTEHAQCYGRDDDIFFVKSLPQARAAIRICQRCPVRQECLDYSVEQHIDVGVWGGLTSRQRTAYATRIQQGDREHATR